MGTWKWAAASSRGTSHREGGDRCQDAQLCRAFGKEGSVLTAIVADGAGSASHGGEGASLVCRFIMRSVEAHFGFTEDLPADETIGAWVADLRNLIVRVAEPRALNSRDFASTLLLGIAGPNSTVFAHVGDGGAVFRPRGESLWEVGSWPAHGEYASTTWFVTDPAGARLRFTRIPAASNAVALFTDGLERMVLNHADRSAHSPFFERTSKPIEAVSQAGRSHILCQSLAQYLDTDAVNSRTDDDKTLVLAVSA